MERDTEKTFQEIHGSYEALLAHMREIERSLEWVDYNRTGIESSLRFLCTVPHGRTADGRIIIRLADQTENRNERNYLAVSYCWNSYPDEVSSCFNYAILAPDGQTRPLRCPPRVLYRALQYAQANSLPFVWIDQECIEQDDPKDVQDHLRSMHKIYSQSKHAIGLLTHQVNDKSQPEALAALLEALRSTGNRNNKSFLAAFDDPLQFAGRILSIFQEIQDDKWFSRTWTFQEKYCSMPYGFRLLLPVSSSLDLGKKPPPSLGKTSRELELHLQSICDAAYLLARLLEEQALSGTASSESIIPERLENNAASLSGFRWNESQGPYGHTLPKSAWSRYGTSSVKDIFVQIEKRDNLVVSDRIAILSNLCSFQFRLNTTRLNFSRYSYSTCVLTLLYHNDILPLLSLLKPETQRAAILMVVPLEATVGQILNGILPIHASGAQPRVSERVMFYAKHQSMLDQRNLCNYYNDAEEDRPKVFYAHDHVWTKEFMRSQFGAPLPSKDDPIRSTLFLEPNKEKQTDTRVQNWSNAATYGSYSRDTAPDMSYGSEDIFLDFHRMSYMAGTRTLERWILVRALEPQSSTSRDANDLAELVARSFDSRTMELLLDRLEAEIQVTDDILLAATENKRNGSTIVQLLLQRRGDTLKVSDQTVETITRYFDIQTIKTLLDKRGEEVRITRHVIDVVLKRWHGRNEIMQLFLQRRGHTIQISRWTVLMSVRFNFSVRQLLSKALADRLAHMNVNSNEQRSNLNDILVDASLAGLEDFLQIMLDKGADINTRSDRCGTALQAASVQGYETIVQMLIGAGANVNAKGRGFSTILQAASWAGNERIVQILLDNGADVNAQGGYYGNTLQAASCRSPETVQTLLDRGADVNAQGGIYGNALQVASYKGCETIVQALLSNGANVNEQGGRYHTALQAASSFGYKRIVQTLLEKGADVNVQGGEHHTALQAAAASYRSYERTIQSLLEKGADVNAQGGEYHTALQAASSFGHKKIVQMLLKKGANINAQGGRYNTALQAAIISGHEMVVKILLKQGADVNIQGGNFNTPLQAASHFCHERIVQALLDNGADVNAQGGRYRNPLRAASVDIDSDDED